MADHMGLECLLPRNAPRLKCVLLSASMRLGVYAQARWLYRKTPRGCPFCELGAALAAQPRPELSVLGMGHVLGTCVALERRSLSARHVFQTTDFAFDGLHADSGSWLDPSALFAPIKAKCMLTCRLAMLTLRAHWCLHVMTRYALTP